jgi:hypothetical protein
MTRVPLGRKGAISNRAPIIEARYRMVRSPSPGAFPISSATPPPSSQISSRTCCGSTSSVTFTEFARACFRAFAIASWAIRYR